MPRTNPLRGRDVELEAIGECLGAVAAGSGAVMLVDGAPGMGKTLLLAEARAMGARAGARVLWGEAHEWQQVVPLAPLLAALVEGPEPVVDLAAVRDLSAVPERRFRLLQELEALLEAAALARPLLVTLDDLQWADRGTLSAVRVLAAQLAGLPVGWVLAMRTGEAGGELQTFRERLREAGAVELRLEPLAPDAVAAMVAGILGAAPDPALLALSRSARGNPFLVVELLEGLREEGMLRVEGGRAELLVAGALPKRLGDSMRERLERLSEPAAEVVRLASVLGRRFSVEQVSAMVGRPPAALLGPLEEALGSDLLTEAGNRLTFRHDLLREAVRATLPATVRRGLQRQAVDVLLDGGAAPVEVAAQLAASAEPGDRRAVATLREAALALRGSDAGTAADLSLRALELAPEDDPGRGTLLADTVLLLHGAMRPQEAGALAGGSLGAGLPAEEEAEVRLSAAMGVPSPDARVAESRRALALPGLSEPMRGRHLAWLAYNLAVGGRFRETAEIASDALARARAAGDEAAVAAASVALAALACREGRFATGVEHLTRARAGFAAGGDAVRAQGAESTLAGLLAELGQEGEALQRAGAAIADAQRDGPAGALRVSLAWRCHLLMARGRLADARAEAEAATVIAEDLRRPLQDAFGVLTRARIALHTGDARELAAATAFARAVPADASPTERRLTAWVRVLAALAANDAASAAVWLADDELPYAAPHLPVDVTLQPQVARIALAAGDAELARRAVDLAVAFARENPGVPLVAAAAAHARGLVGADPGLVGDAAETYRACDRPLLLAAALEDQAVTLGDAGTRPERVALLERALEGFAAAGAEWDAARVRTRLRALGVRRRAPSRRRPDEGWDSLTDSERSVARLVGLGATNREAAERLAVSPHTVSSHLRHTFTKLGINSRVELARIVLQRDHEAAEAEPGPPARPPVT